MYYANGDKYAGEWWQDERHGVGKMNYAAGEEYEGHWDHDAKLEQSTGY